jgi:ABC-type transport system involved in multi-copper enzyme maturation permease subunit
MGASFSAELLKLRKRPATWVLALVWVAIVVLFGYLFTYAFASAPPPEDLPAEAQAQQDALSEELVGALLPANLLENLFVNGIYSGLGSAVVLILGALAAGSEYGWGTLKTALSQRPGRAGVLAGKILALIVFIFLFVLMGLAAGAASSFVVARLEDAAVEWPAVGEVLRGVGVGMLTFGMWGFLGFGLAVLFRGTALAIGLGLAWGLAIESTVAFLPIQNDLYEEFRKLTLGESTSALASVFGSPSAAFGAPEPLIEPQRAVITLSAYILALVALCFVLHRRRDVT